MRSVPSNRQRLPLFGLDLAVTLKVPRRLIWHEEWMLSWLTKRLRLRAAVILAVGRSVTVRVPISIQRRCGRKLVLAPEGATLSAAPVYRRVDSAMVKAVARAFRWREMLERREYATIREIASTEKINESYVGRVLRLTLLAPTVIEAILNGGQPTTLQLEHLMKRFPVDWKAQRDALWFVA